MTQPSLNRQLAALFNRMADCYRYLGPEQRFRAAAYAGAAQTLRNMKEAVKDLAGDIRKLEDLKSIGPSIAEKIIEYLHTGRIHTYEELKKQVPYKLLELMDVEGIGPATIRLLHDRLKVSTPEELSVAINKGKLKGLKNFGEKKSAQLKRALKLDDNKQRYPLALAEKAANRLLKAILHIPGVRQASIAGSIRRKKETIGDIDIILTCEDRNRKKIVSRITHFPFVEAIIAAGLTKVSIVMKDRHMQSDIRLVHDEEYGAALFYFTGSKEHNIHLRGIARQKGWKMNEYGVFDLKSGKRLAGHTEEEIYRLFGMNWIPPEKRTGDKEFIKPVAVIP